jgi:hypothetical protein
LIKCFINSAWFYFLNLSLFFFHRAYSLHYKFKKNDGCVCHVIIIIEPVGIKIKSPSMIKIRNITIKTGDSFKSFLSVKLWRLYHRSNCVFAR